MRSIAHVRKHHPRFRSHVRVRIRHKDSFIKFFKRTVAAQLHLLGAVVSVIWMFVLASLTAKQGALSFWSTMTFCICALVLFSASSIMHFMADGFRVSNRFEDFLTDIDKFAVSTLIAGTYTGLIVKVLPPERYVPILWAIWGFAIVGIVYNFSFNSLPKWIANRAVMTLQYLAMGWMVVFFMEDLYMKLPASQFFLVLLGGFFYTVGAICYIFERPNFSKTFDYHALWHFLVLCGCSSFFFCILRFYI